MTTNAHLLNTGGSETKADTFFKKKENLSSYPFPQKKNVKSKNYFFNEKSNNTKEWNSLPLNCFFNCKIS